MGRSQLLVLFDEKVSVDSIQMIATAIAAGVHTLNHQRQLASEGCGGMGL
jgi:hypothetical protein